MAEEGELVSRRSRRSTAGNRMELALAELALEEPHEPEEDIDFVVDRDEEDIFESDFASTDEETARDDVDEEDRMVREEERRERKTARARVEKATAAAHARQRVTFNPEATSSQPKSKPAQKPKRRVSLGVVVNAETGEIIEGSVGTMGVKRHSQRRHTVMNTSATVNRIKDAEVKRAAIPKKTKMVTRLPTQDELIARALDTEEGNIIEHRDYLRLEEEKRAKARVVKQAIEGPVLRWISKKETIQVEVQPPPTTTTGMGANLYTTKYNFVYKSGAGMGTVGSQAYSMPFYAYTPLIAQSTSLKTQEASTSVPTMASSSHSSENPGPSSANTLTATTSPISQSVPTLSSTSSSNVQNPAVPASSSVSPAPSLQPQTQAQFPAQTQYFIQPHFSYPSVPPAPLITHRTEEVCKNYVIHELSQSLPSNLTWKDTMSAMFGDHVRWDEMRVFTSKGRPLARPVRTCLITGHPAKYRDPRTNVPFANVSAYDVLTRVLERGYVWCSALGCYVGAGETSRRDKDKDPGGDVEGDENTGAGVVEGVDEGQEDGDVEVEAEELAERKSKRRKIRITEG